MIPLTEIVLETENLSKNFGGFTAVDRINFKKESGIIDGLIGPNGAGKTTFFNLISGVLQPTAGRVIWKGDDITTLSEHNRSNLGISRTFQISNLFEGLSVHENIQLSSIIANNEQLNFREIIDSMRKLKSDVEETSKSVGLDRDKLKMKVSNLAHPDKRLVEMAIALARSPELLLLDEPFAGLTGESIGQIKEIVKRKKEEGIEIILVDHNLEEVVDIVDKLTVMHNGKILAEGSPEEIRVNKEVQKVYIGKKGVG